MTCRVELKLSCYGRNKDERRHANCTRVWIIVIYVYMRRLWIEHHYYKCQSCDWIHSHELQFMLANWNKPKISKRKLNIAAHLSTASQNNDVLYRNEQWYYFRYPTKRKRYLSVILQRLQRKAFFLACKHTLTKILPPFSKDKRRLRQIQCQWLRKQAEKY